MEVPAGRWTFAPSDGDALLTPAGEALIDPATLIGRAGVLTGEGLDGLVSGDPACARWDLGTEVCALVPADDMAALVGRGSAEIEQTTVMRADGSRVVRGPRAGHRRGAVHRPRRRRLRRIRAARERSSRSACEPHPLGSAPPA